MTTTDYDTILREAQQLPPEELRRLREELDTINATGERKHAQKTDADTFLNEVDALTARITASWKDDMGAVDAIREQRR